MMTMRRSSCRECLLITMYAGPGQLLNSITLNTSCYAPHWRVKGGTKSATHMQVQLLQEAQHSKYALRHS